MPRIFDNIDNSLLPALQETLAVGARADFCVGYFNLRGWRHLADYVGRWPGGEGQCCRLLVGMQIAPSDELRRALRSSGQADADPLDNQTALLYKRRLAEDFRRQLAFGVPSNADELALRQLSAQLRAKQLLVKLYLPHSLHAKLYLVHRRDANNPMTGFVGSSNLTFAGLAHQGELNVDVLEHDACAKLAEWFEDRWRERWCTMNELPYITRDLAICGGEPVVTGTRITVRTVLASLAEGMDADELLADLPTLTRDGVRAVIAFAASSAGKAVPLPAAPLFT